MFPLAVVELALPVLSAAVTGLGAYQVGYRFRRRAHAVRAAIKQRVKDAQDLRSVLADVKAVKDAVSGDVDPAKVKEVLASIKAKYGLTNEPTADSAS